jgi:drug/metabolite transporter (DMT)-like permease
VIILLDMIFPILLALIIFKEVPTLITIIGGLLIIIGSYLVTLADNKKIEPMME